MHALFVELRALPHQAAVLRDLLEDLTTVAGSETGCIVYSFHIDKSQPDHFFLYELYIDEAACQAHLQDSRVTAVIARFGELLAEEPRITVVNPISTHVRQVD